MNNAKNIPCQVLMYPKDEKYAESIREFQGCPTIAVTKGGRIFLGWYSGGDREPHMDNYNLLIYSDDKGKTWSAPVVIIPSCKERLVHALDIQLWINPRGELCVFWVQNNVEKADNQEDSVEFKDNKPYVTYCNYRFTDFEHAEWCMICSNPDADTLSFGEPRYIDKGFLRCKPVVLKSGRQLYFNYDQNSTSYGYSISDDDGKTVTHMYGATKISTNFDESMAYEMADGTIRMLARTKLDVGELAQSFSNDGGITWSDAELSGIDAPDTRFFVARTPSGRVLLINNDARDSRRNMTVYLSEDDGKTWKYKRSIDPRGGLSYPDADFHDGRIFVTYDRGRTSEKEILFVSFTEDDIMNPDYVFEPKVISKP